MINIEIQPRPKENTLATVAILYPLAFAMVAASNSSAGLALQHLAATDFTALRNDLVQSSKAPPTIHVGLHPIGSFPFVA